MRTSNFKIIGILILAGMLLVPAWGENLNTLSSNVPNPRSTQNPQVGSVNYVEGQASIDGKPLFPSSVGSVELERGQSLTTQAGKVEILLTPGVFLRVDDHSSVSMLSPSFVPTIVELVKGRAMVEVSYIRKENDIRVVQDDASTKLLKKGLYDFDAADGQVRVFKGEADVFVGKRKIDLWQNQEVTLSPDLKPKAKHFKTAQYENDFYNWSRLRSGDILEANAALASEYGTGFYGPGWYWDPWFDSWAFPFDWGWGFYSPFFGYGAPFYGGFGYGGYGPRGGPINGPRGGPIYGGGFGGIRGGGGFHGGGGGGGHR